MLCTKHISIKVINTRRDRNLQVVVVVVAVAAAVIEHLLTACRSYCFNIKFKPNIFLTFKVLFLYNKALNNSIFFFFDVHYVNGVS